MKTFMMCMVLCATLLCTDVFGQGVQSAPAGSGCSGARATPVRNFVASRPVRSILQKITSARSTGSCGSAAASCGSSTVIPVQAPTACSVQESTQFFISAQEPSNDFARAYASAVYRAEHSIKGHVSGELVSGRASSAGVGFSSYNRNPTTCLGVPGQTSATCAVVRGSDGWYSTCVR